MVGTSGGLSSTNFSTLSYQRTLILPASDVWAAKNTYSLPASLAVRGDQVCNRSRSLRCWVQLLGKLPESGQMPLRQGLTLPLSPDGTRGQCPHGAGSS